MRSSVHSNEVLMNRVTPPRRAVTSARSRAMGGVEVSEFEISDTRGSKAYFSLQELKKYITTFKEGVDEKNKVEYTLVKYIGYIVSYCKFFIEECPSNNTTISIRLHYLLFSLFQDLLNFSELVFPLLNNNNIEKSRILVSLLSIESVLYALIHLENMMDAASSLGLDHAPQPQPQQQFLSSSNHISSSSNVELSVSFQTTPSKSTDFLRQRANLAKSQSIIESSNSKYKGLTLKELEGQFNILLNVIVENPAGWKMVIDGCRHSIENSEFKFNGTDFQQSEYNEYVSNMNKAIRIYYNGYNSNPSSYSHCFNWLPALCNITTEDFFATLVHTSIRDEKNVLSVSFLLQYWREIPNAFSSQYMNDLYIIFSQIISIFKQCSLPTEPLANVNTYIDLPIITNKIWRFPPQYFYILLHPRFVAQKLTEAHVTIFTKCQPRAIFYSKQMRRAGIGAMDLKKKVDILAYWVSQSLYETVNQPSLQREFYEYFAEVITQLYYLRHNLLATLGLSIGFSSFRLNKFTRPQFREDTNRIISWVSDVTNPKDGSYPNLIKAMKELGNPCIPYFGSFQNIFEKVLSADIKDVGVLYLNIGKATEETRRNRIKWSDLVYEDSSLVDDAFKTNVNEYFETPWSDTKLFDSMVKSSHYRVFHRTENIQYKKYCAAPLLKTTKGFVLKRISACRYPKYALVL
ncbi:Ras guanine nucleotide exchange factor [Entamoeba marina]